MKIKLSFAVIFLLSVLSLSCEVEEKSPMDELDLAAISPKTTSQQENHAANSDIEDSRSTAITRAVEKVGSAVCGINVIQIQEYRRRAPYFFDDPFFRDFFGNDIFRQPVKSLGSGFLISPDGFILTNEHVVQNAVKIIVVLSDGTTKEAEVVGSDYISDIALLKIPGKDHPYVKLGDSDDVIIGEWVIAIGNPFGLFEINAKPTVTVGVVSAIDRDFGRMSDRVYQDMIQTDAAINRGNSGGPLVNSLGEVIGMNAFIYTAGDRNAGSIGLGFAIPSNRIQRILKDLKAHGEVNRSWRTGLVVQGITRWMAEYFKLGSTKGVIVTQVEPNSSAERAGLRVGDVILKVNDRPIQNENDIYEVIDNADLRGGDVLTLQIMRDSKTFEVNLKLERVRE